MTSLDALPGVLTSKEAATHLRIGIKELRALIDRGELPAARLGPRRVIRIARGAVETLLSGANPVTPPRATVEPCKKARRWKGRPCPRTET